MSKKHEAAIEAQKYTKKLISRICGNCAYRVVNLVLPVWMRRWPDYTPETHGIENNKCGIGGFPVKRLGNCGVHAFAVSQADVPG